MQQRRPSTIKKKKKNQRKKKQALHPRQDYEGRGKFFPSYFPISKMLHLPQGASITLKIFEPIMGYLGLRHFSDATKEQVGLPLWLSDKESTSQCRTLGSIPGSGRSPGEGNGSPLLYSCLGNPMDRGIWRVTVHGVGKESDRT